MRKMHTALFAGAVVVGLGALAGVAAFAPSLVGRENATHELTLQLPGGGTETITYSGKVAPRVNFHAPGLAAFWPAMSDWAMSPVMPIDPLVASMNRHLEMLANVPLLISSVPSLPLSQAALGNLPAGASYSVVSETIGNGVCTRFTQITKAIGDAKPKIVSQNSGNCGTGSDLAGTSQPKQAAKDLNPRSTTPVTTNIL